MSTDTRTRILLQDLAPLREQAEPYDDWQRLDHDAAVAAARIRDCDLPGRSAPKNA
ncbi:hypothetical protein [Saccharopolyspora rhizosphaerae]|uniref:hypothetical protein n=1 Tax=Saccharopolyspora rhizosphaerae TaxID=2492662 RepID=UPI00131586C1|nr:hypothetical protein [Saccharopolyspora rhizosphaerae]